MAAGGGGVDPHPGTPPRHRVDASFNTDHTPDHVVHDCVRLRHPATSNQDFRRLDLGGLGAGMGGAAVFEDMFRARSIAFSSRDTSKLQNGDKIILPHSALEVLTTLHVQYPMMFRLENPVTNLALHVGVAEFTALEGQCLLPVWIMEYLGLGDGGMVLVRNVKLPKATYVKFQPHSKIFLDLVNPKAVLEMQLKTYSALTKGAYIRFTHAGKTHTLDVLELKPAPACSIIETDCVVDFAAPKDYVEPDYKAMKAGGGAAGGAGTTTSAKGSPLLGASTASGSPMLSSGTAAPRLDSALSLDGTREGGVAPSNGVARKAPSHVPFAGMGYTLGASGGAAESKEGGGSGGGGATKTSAAGGVILSSGRPTSAKPKSMSRFEAAKAEKAFTGEGKRVDGRPG